ncbi:penicillin-binding protein activator [Aliiroseovarius sp. YM-037]|uniref:penicillin-binding protein activator n=1 Tax=Aliiroseovarius sp. YM-037 TaxID=3341728 RepID=UPI003A80DD98
MFAVLSSARKSLGKIAIVMSLIWLAACDTVPIGANTGPRINTNNPVPVALLVPRGSANQGDAVLAQSLENAARLAIADLGGVDIDLRVYGTGGQAGLAAQVAQQAVDDGAKIILGPVFAEAANAAGVAVANRNVNVLSFSNNTEIAGGNVFVLGNTFQNSAGRLASYAVRQGKGRIVVVHGQDISETIGRDAVVNAVRSSGGTVAGVRGFEMSQNGVINAIPGIASEVRSSGANAVFFTSGTDGALPLLTQLLPENGIDTGTAQFIGLRRWDIPASAISLPGVQNGWFAVPDPALNARFRERYSAAYGGAPHPIAGLAYDGIAAIGALVKAGNSEALTASALTQGSGFVGVNGVFRLRGDGTNQRGLAVATIRDNQVIVIDPAPRSFGGAGF